MDEQTKNFNQETENDRAEEYNNWLSHITWKISSYIVTPCLSLYLLAEGQ